jgi:hypothetical protein
LKRPPQEGGKFKPPQLVIIYNNKKTRETYAAFAECPGVGRRCEIEPPRIVGDGILPVDETLGSLSNASACAG